MAVGDLITQVGQVELNGLLLGARTSYGIRSMAGLGIPDVRSSDRMRPQDDGAFPGQDFYGERTIRFVIDIDATLDANPSAKLQALQNVFKVTRSGTVDMAFQLRGEPVKIMHVKPRRLAVVYNEETIALQAPTVLAEVDCPDPRIYEKTLNAQSAIPSTSSEGRLYNRTYPVTYGSGSGGVNAICNNIGIFPTRPVVTVLGPGKIGVNLLTLNQATVETNTTGFVAISNCGISRALVIAAEGLASLQLSSTLAGTMQAGTTGGTGAVAVNPGVQYTALASFRTALLSRSANVGIQWLDSAGNTVNTEPGPSVYTLSLPGTSSNYASTPNDDANRTGNRFTKNQASLETSTNGWLPNTNCTLSRSTAQAADGTASLLMTATAAGTISAATRDAKSAFRVLPSTQYIALASFKAGQAVITETTQVTVKWLDSTGAFISNVVVGTGTINNATFTPCGAAGITSPANAAYAAVVPTVFNGVNTSLYYVDKLSFAAGSSTTWTPGREEDLEIIVDLAADDWTPGAQVTFVAKDDVSNLRSFSTGGETTGAVTLRWSPDNSGASEISVSSTANLSLADLARKKLKIKLDIDNGSNQRVITFETSDDLVTWTLLGTAITQAGATSIGENATPITVGIRGSTASPFAGKVYSASVGNTIGGGALIANPSFDQNATTHPFVSNQATFTDSLSNTWTVFRSASAPQSSFAFVSGSTDVGTAITDSALAWIQASASGAAPANAAFGRLVLIVADTVSASELHFVDKMSLAAGSSVIWAAPGGGTGSLASPRLTNVSTGKYIEVNTTLVPSDMLVIDFAAHTVKLNGTSVYSTLTSGSEWWELIPGSNEIAYSSTSASPGSIATVSWQSAWI